VVRERCGALELRELSPSVPSIGGSYELSRAPRMINGSLI